MHPFIRILKPKHYIKNLIVFIPLFFSHEFEKTLCAFITFVSFCLISSAVYILNDIIDFKEDKLHPIKSKRVLASGQIKKTQARGLFILLVILSISCFTNFKVTAIIFIYLLLNGCYSFCLKQIPIIDTAIIALGFILRILSGCAAIYVIPSPLVILLTFFTSMFFTFAKRKLEFKIVDKKLVRKSLQSFNETLLNQYVAINAALSVAFYFTYTLDEKLIAKTGADFLYITVIPFSIVIFRLLFLIFTAENTDDPSNFILKDKMTAVLICTYFITLFAVLYF